MTNEQLDALFRANDERGGFSPRPGDWELMSVKLDRSTQPISHGKLVSATWVAIFTLLIAAGVFGLNRYGGDAVREIVSPTGALPVQVIQQPTESLATPAMVEVSPEQQRSAPETLESPAPRMDEPAVSDLDALAEAWAARDVASGFAAADSLAAAKAAATYKQNTSLAQADPSVVTAVPPVAIQLEAVVDAQEAELLVELSGAEHKRTDSLSAVPAPLTELPARTDAKKLEIPEPTTATEKPARHPRR